MGFCLNFSQVINSQMQKMHPASVSNRDDMVFPQDVWVLVSV